MFGKIGKSIVSAVIIGVMAVGMAGCSLANNMTAPASQNPATSQAATSEVKLEPFPKSGTISGMEYTIQSGAAYYREGKKAGYFIDTLDEPDAPMFYFIYSGDESHLVNIVNIEADTNNNLVVTVDFNATSADAKPSCTLTLKPQLGSVTIQTVSGYVLEPLDD